jgi:hypothetical protein
MSIWRWLPLIRAGKYGEWRGISIKDDVLNAVQETVAGGGEVPSDLHHPGLVRVIPAIATRRVFSFMTKKRRRRPSALPFTARRRR